MLSFCISSQLQHLLNVDLGGRRHGSFNPSSLSRPPPIGRSQSSSDLHINRIGSSPTEKKTTISPLAKEEAKRFSFDSVSKKQNFSAKDSRTGIALMVTDADKDSAKRPESPQTEIHDGECVSPSTVRRDNIDGCESEKEISDVGERSNAGFSGDDEGAGDPMIDMENCNFSNEDPAEDSQMEESINAILMTCTSQEPQKQLENTVNYAVDQEADTPAYNLARTTNDPKVEGLGKEVPNGTLSCQGISGQLGAMVAHQAPVASISGLKDAPGIQDTKPEDHFSSTNPAKPVSSPKADFVLDSTSEVAPSSLVIGNFNVVLDKNGNLRGSEKLKTIAIQEESSGRTLDSDRHEDTFEGREHVPVEGSSKDVPAYKKKSHRKKDKTGAKNDKIEKTFFV